MPIGKYLKRTVQAVAAIWLLFMLFIGIGGTYLEHNPASGLAALGGFAFVDPEAGVFTQAGQFFNGAAKAGKVVSDEKRDEANDKANREIERKEAEARRFNEPHYYSDDDFAPS